MTVFPEQTDCRVLSLRLAVLVLRGGGGLLRVVRRVFRSWLICHLRVSWGRSKEMKRAPPGALHFCGEDEE